MGGRSNAPPPAGGGKSRGPAGRGSIVREKLYVFKSQFMERNTFLLRTRLFALKSFTRETSSMRNECLRRFKLLNF